MKSIFTLVLIALISWGCTSAPKDEVLYSTERYSPIVRLNQDNSFVCTAFVISDRYAITAAHCVHDPMLSVFGMSPIQDSLTVSNSLGTLITNVKVVALDPRVDFAVIRGNFTSFKKVEIDSTGEQLWTAESLTACGYPYGVMKLKCSKMTVIGTRFFNLHAKGQLLFPGHSGGPVFDARNNIVIGINSAVSENGIVIAPLIHIWDIIDGLEGRL